MLLKGKGIWRRLSRQFMQPKRFAVIEACAIGLVSALAAILLQESVGWIGSWRVRAAGIFPAYFVLPMVGLVGGWLAGWLIERFAPETSGSGMPEVKAVLAGVPIPLDLRVAWFKLISAMLVLGSGLPLGREGPTVQIGAALAAQLSRWTPTSPEQRRQLIAAGAGAGLAAAFNAPIAGVLFVVEELLQDVSGLTLGTAILASFIGSTVARAFGSHSLDLDLNLVAPATRFFVPEIPFYLILGVLAGGLGALFNRGVLASLNLNRRLRWFNLPARIGLAGAIVGLVVAMLPIVFWNQAELRELLFAGQAGWQLAGLAFIAQFCLILVAAGSGAPGGLLVPTLILGAALGYLVGAWQHHFLGLGLATTYARVGMGAFFGAVARVPITAIVLVFEMTADFNLVLPLMISSVAAWAVGEGIDARSLYDRLLEWKGIHLEKKPKADGLWAELTAADIMQPRVETLSSQMNLDEVLQAFSRSSHHCFPIVEEGKLVGILTQKDLANLAQQRLNSDVTIREIMTPNPISVRPIDMLAQVLYLLNRYRLSSLPVTEGRRLVGIITRSDIIRAEADYLHNEARQVGFKPEPSVVVSQERVPATGRGRLLVPLGNPDTAEILLRMAIAIARDRHYELECLSVEVVPRHLSPAEAPFNTRTGKKLLQQAVRLGQISQVPVHSQIRVAHEISGAILDTIKEQHIDLVVMGWKGNTLSPGRIFSQVVDTIIRQAPCDVVLVKIGKLSLERGARFDRWLVPMAGGPNAQRAVELLPALTSLSHAPAINLCQVFVPDEAEPDATGLDAAARFLERRIDGSITLAPVCAQSIVEAVMDMAQKGESDVVVLGASRENLLQRAIGGNIPESIARQNDRITILVRGARS